MPKLAIEVMHVPNAPERSATLAALLASLAPHPATIHLDPEQRGPRFNMRQCLTHALAGDAEWIIVLNDDAAPCDDFVRIATRALATRAPRDVVCFYANHARAVLLSRGGWYVTRDGMSGVGIALSRESALDWLRFTDEELPNATTQDAPTNVWAMVSGRCVFCTVPSLVEHALPDVSLVGNEHRGSRRASVPPDARLPFVDWTRAPIDYGRRCAAGVWDEAFADLRTPRPDVLAEVEATPSYLDWIHANVPPLCGWRRAA